MKTEYMANQSGGLSGLKRLSKIQINKDVLLRNMKTDVVNDNVVWTTTTVVGAASKWTSGRDAVMTLRSRCVCELC